MCSRHQLCTRGASVSRASLGCYSIKGSKTDRDHVGQHLDGPQRHWNLYRRVAGTAIC